MTTETKQPNPVGRLLKALAGLTPRVGRTTGAQRRFKSGERLRDKGDFQEALSVYDEAIRLNPELAMAYNGRGVAYGNLGQYERVSNKCCAPVFANVGEPIRSAITWTSCCFSTSGL